MKHKRETDRVNSTNTGTPYMDDGRHCPECGTSLTIDKQADEAYCENCNFTIFDYSEEL